MRDKIKSYKFQIILFVLLGIFLTITIGHIIQVGWTEFLKEFGNNDRPFSIRNIAIGIAAIATAIFTWWKNTISKEQVEVAQKQTEEQIKQTQNLIRQTDNAQRQTENLIEQTKNSQRQIELQEDTRLDSLYAKAVEFLNEKNDLITRKAGTHILKDLAINSTKHTQKCIDMLCSVNESWMPQVLKKNSKFFYDEEFDWLNNIILDSDLQDRFGLNDVPSHFMHLIPLSQTVLKHIQLIIEHFNSLDVFIELDLSFKYLCSLRFTGGITNNNFNFENSILVGAKFEYCNCDGFDFTNCDLQGAYFKYCNFEQAIFSNSKLDFSSFLNSKFPHSDFTRVDLSLSGFNKCDFKDGNFLSAKLNGLNASDCNFENANFTGAKIIMSDFSYCSLKGIFAPRTDFHLSYLYNSDFWGADFSSTNFIGAKLNFSDFSGTTFSECNFRGTSFYFSKLDSVVFIGGELTGAAFEIENIPVIIAHFYEIKDEDFFDLDKNRFVEYQEEIIPYALSNYPEDYRGQYKALLIDAYNIYQENKNENLFKYVEVLKAPEENFLNSRNSIATRSIDVARSMIRCSIKRKGKFIELGEEDSQLLKEINLKLVYHIQKEKPNWYSKFVAEGIIIKE